LTKLATSLDNINVDVDIEFNNSVITKLSYVTNGSKLLVDDIIDKFEKELVRNDPIAPEH